MREKDTRGCLPFTKNPHLVHSLHNRRSMSQARRTRHFARSAKRVRSARRGEVREGDSLLTSAVSFCQQLETPVMAKGNVELWLGDLLNQAMNSLHAVIRDAYLAINDGGFNLMNFLGQFPSQVSSLPSFFQGIPPRY